MFIDIARMLIDTAASVIGTTLLLRAYIYWLGMPSRDQLSQFVFALTDWAVKPLKKVLPRTGRWDTASLLAAYLISLLALILIVSMTSANFAALDWGSLLLLGFTQMLHWALYMVFFLVIIYVVLSWVNPYAPVAPVIGMLIRPFLRPFQKIIPPVGGFDLSPLFLIVVVNILLLVLARHGI